MPEGHTIRQILKFPHPPRANNKKACLFLPQPVHRVGPLILTEKNQSDCFFVRNLRNVHFFHFPYWLGVPEPEWRASLAHFG
jgi:hypothetical protein